MFSGDDVEAVEDGAGLGGHGVGWRPEELLIVALLIGTLVRIAAALVGGIAYGLSPVTFPPTGEVVGQTLTTIGTFADISGALVLVVAALILYWRTSHWSEVLDSLPDDDWEGPLQEAVARVGRSRTLCTLALVLSVVVAAGAGCYIAGEVIDAMTISYPTSTAVATYSVIGFFLASMVIALAAALVCWSARDRCDAVLAEDAEGEALVAQDSAPTA